MASLSGQVMNISFCFDKYVKFDHFNLLIFTQFDFCTDDNACIRICKMNRLNRQTGPWWITPTLITLFVKLLVDHFCLSIKWHSSANPVI